MQRRPMKTACRTYAKRIAPPRGPASRPSSPWTAKSLAVARCDVKDLSRSGICVVTRDPIAPGRAVHIQLRGPGARIALIGQIVWVRPAGQSRFEIGCWHVPDGAESRERLEQLVREFQTPLSTP